MTPIYRPFVSSIKDVNLKKDKIYADNKEVATYFSLSITYEIENDTEVIERTVSDIPLHLRSDPLITSCSLEDGSCEADFGFGTIYFGGGHKLIVNDKIIKNKIKEMTVEEIEKKLGYKIKIISEDKK